MYFKWYCHLMTQKWLGLSHILYCKWISNVNENLSQKSNSIIVGGWRGKIITFLSWFSPSSLDSLDSITRFSSYTLFLVLNIVSIFHCVKYLAVISIYEIWLWSFLSPHDPNQKTVNSFSSGNGWSVLDLILLSG